MQERHLFEYAMIRVVPKVEREEFINIGVILYCAAKKFLECRIDINTQRLNALDPSVDLQILHQNLTSFELICKGGASGGTIGGLPAAERFRWLTAARSTMIQCSKVHPGLCDDPSSTLSKLFAQLVQLPTSLEKN